MIIAVNQGTRNKSPISGSFGSGKLHRGVIILEAAVSLRAMFVERFCRTFPTTKRLENTGPKEIGSYSTAHRSRVKGLL